ncbi:ketopantoate reductase family protein [Steroidobacter agaridevorans]|uniref:ketopantoate reductase family protein n=1 Tax=Steroidobacter agaridevorans TaxID=2695856 RepID=UPI001320A68C|nr:2-dehydropantoate 2-reductase [Steroidobacter agaridevorans]GFE86627.1 2-dehydropantoate 2-reductase [Steroidobacter agaridevorans]
MARSEFAIVGAGALGSILAAHLIRNGRSVALLARGQRAQQLREQGLRIKGLSEIAMPVEVITDPAQLRETGTLIIATKTPGSEQTMASLRHVKVDRAVSIQNGVMKDELLSQTYGREHTLGALADTSGELLASGEVLFTRNVNLFVGELDGSMSDTARGIVKTIDDAGVRATLVPDIVSREWSKFVGWVGFVSLSLTTRVVTWKFLSDPDAALLIARLTRELGSLARALGIALTEDRAILPLGLVMNGTEAEAVAAVQKVGADYQTKAPEHRMSSLQDLLAGRPLEIHETLGYALRKAKELNLALPLLASLYSLVSAIDRTRDR